MLGLDLQGGSSLLLEVDTNAVRKERLQAVADDVLRMLRQARLPFTGRAVRGNSVEVKIMRDSDTDTALNKLRELSVPLSGIVGSTEQRSLDVLPRSPARSTTCLQTLHEPDHGTGDLLVDSSFAVR